MSEETIYDWSKNTGRSVVTSKDVEIWSHQQKKIQELEAKLSQADRLVNCLSVICEEFGKSDSKINLIISPETKESICEIKKSICEYRAIEALEKGE